MGKNEHNIVNQLNFNKLKNNTNNGPWPWCPLVEWEIEDTDGRRMWALQTRTRCWHWCLTWDEQVSGKHHDDSVQPRCGPLTSSPGQPLGRPR